MFCLVCYCQRRLAIGIDSIIGKKYMVYFVQSPFTRNFQNSWVCGGALVTPTQILTAAACLIEAENIYAIAGYKKYVKAENIENDECTKTKKQRVVKILIPTGYKLDYENPAQRMNIDIGVAVVEKPYNFSDLNYLIHCSYEPQPIMVNLENKHELINSRAVALGWGVKGKTQPKLTKETKYHLLQETSTIIVDKKICTNVSDTPEIVQRINKYHLCGIINFQEIPEDNVHETQSFDAYKMRHHQSGSERNNSDIREYFGYRRSYNKDDDSDVKEEEQTENITLETGTDIQMNITNNNNFDTRKSLHLNICQNNLGSPLIKWIHDKEVIIGITSSTNINGECNGPFLYVSTAASSKIIKCLLETNPFTRKLCNRKINDEPYEIQEIDITWPNYQQSKILEPMLLIQQAVLDKLQPLKPRATLNYTNRGAYINSTKKYSTQQRLNSSNEHESQYENVYQQTDIPKEYAQLRAQLPPLLSRPQYDIENVRHQKEQQYNPVSDELPSTQYYKDLPRPQKPSLLSRPQYDIDVRYQEEQQKESLSEEFPSTQYNKQLVRPQFSLQADKQYQPLKSAREPKLDYRQEYTIPDNQKYESASYHQYDPQKLQQHAPRYKQNKEGIQEGYHYSLIREQYQPEPVQLYGSTSGEEYNPLGEHQYDPPPKQQQHEPPTRPQHGLPTSREHASALEQQYPPIYELSQSQQHNADLGHRLQNKQSEPLVSRQVYLPSTPYHYLQHESIRNKSIKQHFQQPELLYDFSPELQFGAPDLKPNQPPESVQSQISLQKPPTDFSNSEQKLYQRPQMGRIESPYQKSLVQSSTTILSDDESFSFAEIFAQLQNLPSESQTQINTATPEETLKQIYERVQLDSTPDEPYKENNQQRGIYKSNTEILKPPDDVMIRPQIPMNKQYDEIN